MRILVAVGSRHGSTRELGAAVAQVLTDGGHRVDLVDPEDVPGVGGYDAVVLGSAVYADRICAGVRDLLARQGGQLAVRPTWLFWSGPLDGSDPAVPPPEVQDAGERVRAVQVRGFPGRLRAGSLDLAERSLVAGLPAEEDDLRDFDEVDRWAASVAEHLDRLPAVRYPR